MRQLQSVTVELPLTEQHLRLVRMSISAPAKQVGRSMITWDSSAAEPFAALRAAASVAVVLVVTHLLGYPGWGVAAVYGAWASGIPQLSPAVNSRPSLSLLVGGTVSLAILLGGITAPLPIVMVIAAAAWAFIMAFIGAVDGTAGLVTTVCGVAFVLGPHLAVNVSIGAVAAAAACGALVQTAFSYLPPWRRFRVESQALADAYRALAVDATVLADAMNTSMSTEALHKLRELYDNRRKLPDAMRESVGALYELRTAIIAVAAARARLLDRDPTAARQTARVLRNTTIALDILANGVERESKAAPDWEAQLAEAVKSAPGDGTAHHFVAGQEVHRLQRAVHRTARLAERVSSTASATSDVSRKARARSRAGEYWHALRANFTWQSPSMRHALRATVTIGLATIAGLLWPEGHGYWIPLTAWIVLKADFAATVTTGIGRMLGSAAGAVIASFLATGLLQSPKVTVFVVGFYALAGYLTLPVSYTVYSAVIAGFAVFQIDMAGDSPMFAAWDRGLCTLAGGVLALVLYALWPTWQTRRLPDFLVSLIEAYRDYANIVLDMQARPAERDPKRLQRTIDEVRLKRANLRAAAEKAAAEPIGGPRPYSSDVLDVEESLEKALRSLIVLEGNVRVGDAAHLYGIDEFREAVTGEYDRLAQWISKGRPGPRVDLDTALDDLDSALSTGSEFTEQRRRLLDWETDFIVEALHDSELIIAEWQRGEP